MPDWSLKTCLIILVLKKTCNILRISSLLDSLYLSAVYAVYFPGYILFFFFFVYASPNALGFQFCAFEYPVYSA